MVLALLGVVALPGQRSLADMLALLQMVMFLSAMWTALFAWAAREPPQPGRLNLWDEAMAFTALFLLVRILRTVVLGSVAGRGDLFRSAYSSPSLRA